MKIETFLSRHGEVWEQFKRDPIYPDLIATLRALDPSRSMHLVTAKDATENTAHLLGRIAGFNLAIGIMEEIQLQQSNAMPEETWGIEKE